MFIGMGMPIPDLSNLPGVSRPGGGGPSGPSVDLIDNNYSMLFDRASDTYFQTNMPAMGNSNDMCISYWIKTDASFSWVPMYSVLANTIGVHNNSFGRCYFRASNLIIQFGTAYGTTVLNDNQWHHIVEYFTFDAAGGGTQGAYIDGVEEVFSLNTGYPTAVTTPTLPAWFKLPTYYFGAPVIGYYNGSYPWEGYIDEVGIWTNRKISLEEAKAIYDATNNNPGKTADLSTLSTGAPTAWYRMGD